MKRALGKILCGTGGASTDGGKSADGGGSCCYIHDAKPGNFIRQDALRPMAVGDAVDPAFKHNTNIPQKVEKAEEIWQNDGGDGNEV